MTAAYERSTVGVRPDGLARTHEGLDAADAWLAEQSRVHAQPEGGRVPPLPDEPTPPTPNERILLGLPQPTGARNWLRDAACKGMTAEDADAVFYPEGPRGRPPVNSPAPADKWKPARALCGGCPVAGDCLNAALVDEQSQLRFGMRGGMTPDDRDRIMTRTLPQHGTYWRYKNHSCTCEPCKRANARRARENRSAGRWKEKPRAGWRERARLAAEAGLAPIVPLNDQAAAFLDAQADAPASAQVEGVTGAE